MDVCNTIKKELRKKGSSRRVKNLLWFFKTGKGEYGEGDKFLGLIMSEQRIIARKFASSISLVNILKLLRTSTFHEERMVALLMLVMQYAKGDSSEREQIYQAYLANTRFINNWDLVDATCRDIVGAHLYERDRKILLVLARSSNLWERRIAIVSTFYFISKGELTVTFKIAKILLADSHDLIHKAVGWALREAGKKDKARLKKFLKVNIRKIPRTTLRYAIERFPEAERKSYLAL